MAGDPILAELIRNAGIPSVVSPDGEPVEPNPVADPGGANGDVATAEAELVDAEMEDASLESVTEAEPESPPTPLRPPSVDHVMTSLAADEDNSVLDEPADVDGDGLVTGRDVLILVNRLSQDGDGEAEQVAVTWDLDTNRDGEVTAHDLLYVINRLV